MTNKPDDDNEFARYLASYLFDTFGTVRGRDDGDYLNVTDLYELMDAIKEFQNTLP